MARFAQYAMAATDEALEDAGWKPSAHEQREATVGSMSLMIESSLIFFFRTGREFAWALALATSTRSTARFWHMTRG